MYCIHCGTELPDQANFCWQCGKPQRAQAPSPAAHELRWESCQIEWAVVSSAPSQAKLWADARGSQGSYNAGEVLYAVPVLTPGSKQTESAHKELVAQLTRAGWEALPERGEAWFNTRFRRRIR